jgi:hypothetical protein
MDFYSLVLEVCTNGGSICLPKWMELKKQNKQLGMLWTRNNYMTRQVQCLKEIKGRR